MNCSQFPNALSDQLITINSLISSLTRSHRPADALRLFFHLHSSTHLSPDHYTLASALAACASLLSTTATQIHSLALRSGLLSYTHVANSLLSYYAKSHNPSAAHLIYNTILSPDAYSHTTIITAYTKTGHVPLAIQLFNEMPHRDTAVWNSLITGCIQHCYHDLVLHLFIRMHRSGVAHDHYTFASVAALCCSLKLVALGRQVHSMVVKTGFLEFKVSVMNALVTMYFECGLVADACGLFEEATMRDEITYNAVIAGLAKWGRVEEVLMVFKEMGLRPTELTFVSALNACLVKEIGEQVHAQTIRTGLEASVLVGNAALTMYAKCGDILSARRIFDAIDDKDVVSWNSMISGYSQERCYVSAVGVYHSMQMARIEPDEFTYGSLITSMESMEHAEVIQAVVVKNGLISSIEVCNAVLSTYAKFGDIDCAYRIFGDMSCTNIISWNSIVSGCLVNGFPLRGLESFTTLSESGLNPNSHTLSTVLSICASISALRHGKEVHGYVLRFGSDCETLIGNSLITMYAKCGDLKCCSKVFYLMHTRDIVTWNVIIAAYAQNGDGHRAIHYFNKLQDSAEIPDEITFTNVLSACSHAGKVEEGRRIFSSMVEGYGVKPGVDHYSCFIDLLGRAGHLDEAERLINSMPGRVDSHIWWALLSACNTHGNLRLGRIAARALLETKSDNRAIYTLLANIHAAEGQWEEASIVRERMRENRAAKLPGFSWINSESRSSAFTV